MTIAEDPGPWDEGVIVERRRLARLVDAYREEMLQNHRRHFDWNEGCGDFSECSRRDCAEARSILEDW